ncbi:hypothetical protein HU200_015833 [Digitaria exilis]|uniref:Uncharacterized protein n=1 Tax=Digitaria exilis TaxID=1010633 RepID=A0A835F8Q5_9POAL|nr:hypothetical protein HU200_015833 [Digitaria exilis]
MTTPLDTDEVLHIREKIASFIIDHVLPKKGEFHWPLTHA